jgi:hypothetical protein
LEEDSGSYDGLPPASASFRGSSGTRRARVIIFFAQVLLLIGVGRLLSEWMQRIGRPRRDRPIARWDYTGAERFWRDLASGPTSDLFAQFIPKMLNAVSELGVLLLLLLTGMETHLAL